jgi:hypothetical protein
MLWAGRSDRQKEKTLSLAGTGFQEPVQLFWEQPSKIIYIFPPLQPQEELSLALKGIWMVKFGARQEFDPRKLKIQE